MCKEVLAGTCMYRILTGLQQVILVPRVEMAPGNFGKEKGIVFHWMVTFDWKNGERFPFQCYLNSVFNDKIPDAWFNGEITDSLRQEQHEIVEFPKKKFSFFCKVDKGIKLL